jgi:hypothetical protein
MVTRVGIIEAWWVLGSLLVAAACDLETGTLETGSFADHRKGGGGGGGGGGGSGGGGGTWAGNGLVELDVSDVDPAHGLDTNAGLHVDADSLQLATYLVECALPPGESLQKPVDGETIVLQGALGLAPEWQDEPCDEDCQEWVSACLLARINVAGESVDLWLTAEHPAIGLGHAASLPIYEATFYGNVFEGQQYVCRGSQGGLLGDYLDDRTCAGEPLASCGFSDFGECDTGDRCDHVQGFAVDCAAGADPSTGPRYRSISTFVSLEGW